jgi:prolyl-tRNA synthetase
VRLAIGPRDLENGNAELVRRDTLEKQIVKQEGIAEYIEKLLEEIQQNIYEKARKHRDSKLFKVDTYDELKAIVNSDGGGFVLAHWDGTPETEAKIKEETKATIRCIPFDSPDEDGVCVYSGKPSKRRVLFAKSY